MSQDLSLIPLDALYTEILSRFDDVAIVCLKVRPQQKLISRRWKGEHHRVAGLCLDVANLVLADWYKNQENISIDDL